MTTNKVILLALLGLSALNCADIGPKARVEDFLAKPTYQADFQKLGDEEKKQLAKDLDEVKDQIFGVKKNLLSVLCAPYLKKGPAKGPVEVPKGGHVEAYKEALAKNAGPKAVVEPKKLQAQQPGDVSAVIQPPKPPVAVSGSVAEKLAFFQKQSAALQVQADAKKGKSADQDEKLLKLQAEIDGLKGPLEAARVSFDQASASKQRTETLSKQAAEDADTAAMASASASAGQDAEVDGYFDAGKVAEKIAKKESLYAKYKITDENAMQVIMSLDGKAATYKDALFMYKCLAEDYLARATVARAAANEAHHQAIEQEAQADRILKDLEARFNALSAELDRMK